MPSGCFVQNITIQFELVTPKIFVKGYKRKWISFCNQCVLVKPTSHPSPSLAQVKFVTVASVSLRLFCFDVNLVTVSDGLWQV